MTTLRAQRGQQGMVSNVMWVSSDRGVAQSQGRWQRGGRSRASDGGLAMVVAAVAKPDKLVNERKQKWVSEGA
jgi:hypothetical protein